MYDNLTQEQKEFVDKLVTERDGIIRRVDKLKGKADARKCCMDLYIRDCTMPLATEVI